MDSAYYIALDDALFEELKTAAKAVWDKYDDTHNYASEKKERVDSIRNISDNAMYIIGMFDDSNQRELSRIISDELRAAIVMRLEGVNNYYALNIFNT